MNSARARRRASWGIVGLTLVAVALAARCDATTNVGIGIAIVAALGAGTLAASAVVRRRADVALWPLVAALAFAVAGAAPLLALFLGLIRCLAGLA